MPKHPKDWTVMRRVLEYAAMHPGCRQNKALVYAGAATEFVQLHIEAAENVSEISKANDVAARSSYCSMRRAVELGLLEARPCETRKNGKRLWITWAGTRWLQEYAGYGG